MRVIAKMPVYIKGKLYKRGEAINIETASFNPLTMAEIPESKAVKVTAETKAVELAEAQAETVVEKPKRARKKRG